MHYGAGVGHQFQDLLQAAHIDLRKLSIRLDETDQGGTVIDLPRAVSQRPPLISREAQARYRDVAEDHLQAPRVVQLDRLPAGRFEDSAAPLLAARRAHQHANLAGAGPKQLVQQADPKEATRAGEKDLSGHGPSAS